MKFHYRNSSTLYLQNLNFIFPFKFQQSARSRDDLDMEQALGPRGLSTPDVIKSALDQNNETVPKVNTSPFDNLFGVPDKITIPERYVPEPVSIIYTL